MGPAASCLRAPPAATETPQRPSSTAAAGTSTSTKQAETLMVNKKVDINAVVNAKVAAVEVSQSKAAEVKGTAKVVAEEKHFAHGCAVSTPYGIGVVSKIRPDQFYVISLDFGAKAFLNPGQVKAAPVPAIGSSCSTVYGDGKVKEVRKEDGVVVVELNFGAKAFLRSDQVRHLRAYPFVPAAYWTSGIFSSPLSAKPLNGASKASAPVKAEPSVQSAKRPQDFNQEEPTPADPSEEKDASDVPPPAQAQPPTVPQPVMAPSTSEAEAANGDADDDEHEAAPLSTTTTSSATQSAGGASKKNKKKKRGKN
jgi:hypothetical protein